MEEEFTTSTTWKIFYGLIAAALIIFALYLSTVDRSKAGDAILIFPVLLLAGGAAILYNLYKRKVTISGYAVSYTSIFGTKELLKADIKGFRAGQKAIMIEPQTDGYSKVTIRDYSSIGGHKELIDWLQNNYADLNMAEYNEERAEILNDVTLGATQQDREAKLKQAVLFSQIYTYAGMAMFFLIFYLHPESSLVPIGLLLYPLIGFALYGYGKGLIRLFNKKGAGNSAYPSIAMGLIFASGALVMKSLVGINMITFTNFWLPFTIVAMVAFVTLYSLIQKRTSVSLAGDIIFALIIALIYAGGSTLDVNSGFDSSSAKVYKAVVTGQHITRGKSTSYHLDLGEWGPDHISGNVTVQQNFYNNVAVNDTINVNVKKGVLNIPWFYLSR